VSSGFTTKRSSDMRGILSGGSEAATGGDEARENGDRELGREGNGDCDRGTSETAAGRYREWGRGPEETAAGDTGGGAWRKRRPERGGDGGIEVRIIWG
jgi:hypothetical protein